jgi:LysR family hydrogen peroxide-inducible transcriptional activator
MNISLTQLEYVVAIDEYRNFAKAAESCFVTQPTLSMQLKKLEEELSTTLFDRSRQPIIPTDTGMTIIAQARIILREAKKLEQLSLSINRQFEGFLSIGIIPTLAPYLMPYFIGPFLERYPKVQLKIQELKTEDIIAALQKDKLDAGILATPLHEPGLTEDVLFYEEIFVYAQAQHPLLQKKQLEPKDLLRNDIWMLTQGNCFRNQIINICSMEVGNKHLLYESGSLETLKKMVETEGGFTLLPELAVLELSTREMNRVVSFKKPKPLREVGLVYTRTVLKRNLLEALKKEILLHLPRELQNRKRGNVVEWK